MIRIMILDDDEMYLKKEKDITEQYFAEKNVDCTVTIYQNVEWFLLGLNEEKFDMYILDAWRKRNRGSEGNSQTLSGSGYYIYYKFCGLCNRSI